MTDTNDKVWSLAGARAFVRTNTPQSTSTLVGEMPDDVVLARVRTILFRDFVELHRFRQIRSIDVHDIDGCEGVPEFVTTTYGLIANATKISNSMRGRDLLWEAEKARAFGEIAIEASARWKAPFTVGLRWHEGTCLTCGGERRMKSVIVSCEWQGRTFTLEYAL